MYRIGIIGSENSHADAFSRIFNTSGEYPDIRVVAIYGEDRAASEKIYEKYGLEKLCNHPSEMDGMVDAIMVTSRHGGLHMKYALPFIKKGLPAFIDKPIACCPEEAKELVREAKASGSVLIGGSSTRLVKDTLSFKEKADAAKAKDELWGGHVWAPVSMLNPYGDFWFYASHLVEIALTIFGYEPFEARAYKTDSGVAASLNYGKYAVQLSFTEGNYAYGATVLAKEIATGNIDISDCYQAECDHFADMLRNKTEYQNAHDFVEAVCVMDAIVKSYQADGMPVKIVNLR